MDYCVVVLVVCLVYVDVLYGWCEVEVFGDSEVDFWDVCCVCGGYYYVGDVGERLFLFLYCFVCCFYSDFGYYFVCDCDLCC